MKQKYLFAIIYLIYSVGGHGQNWQGLSSGTNGSVRTMFTDSTNNLLYVGGNFWKVDGVSTKSIANWDGANWSPMGTGTAINLYPTISIINYQNRIYRGVFCGNNGALTVWDGNEWDTVGDGVNNPVWTMKCYDNLLYFGGSFSTVGGIPCLGIAKWNGHTFSCIEMPSIIYPSRTINSICYYNGELYVAGQFYSNGLLEDSLKNIIRYDGVNWKQVSGGIHGATDEVNCMIKYKNELYVGGNFTKSHGNTGNYIQKWNGSSWSEVGESVMGFNSSNGQIFDMDVFNNELYVVGVFSYAGGIPAQYIAKWNGAKWCGLGNAFDNSILSLEVFQNELYIGGGFQTIDGDTISYIAKWIGGSYVDTCGNTSSVDETDNEKNAMSVYPNPITGNEFTVSFPFIKTGTLQVFNLLGETLGTYEIRNNNKISINGASFKSGCYLLRVKSDSSIFTGKFVKQ